MNQVVEVLVIFQQIGLPFYLWNGGVGLDIFVEKKVSYAITQISRELLLSSMFPQNWIICFSLGDFFVTDWDPMGFITTVDGGNPAPVDRIYSTGIILTKI